MSLNGTLETFALPDVLALLAATRKTGELQVNGGRGDARVWLDKGQMVAADVPRATTFVDAIFEMLRLTSGKFAFDNDGRAPDPSEPVSLEPLLQEAQSRLGEWRSIEAVVPSPACAVSLATEVSTPHVTVSGEQWRALVAVASSRDVDAVMTRLGLGEFACCRILKDLVHTGLVSIGEPLAAPEPAPVARQEPAPAPAPAPTAALDASALVAASRAGAAPATLDASAVVAASRAGARPAAQAVKPAVAGARPTAQPSKPPVAGARPAVAGTGSTPADPTTPVGPRPRITPMLEGDAGTAPVVPPARRRAPAPAAAPAADPAKVDAMSKSGATPEPGATPAPEAAEVRQVPSGAAARINTSSGGETDAEAAPADAGEEEEPLNRGLLLKFLNSVRS